MKDKKKLTIEEKEILLAALDHYIDASKRIRPNSTQDDITISNPELLKFQEVRKKLIIGMYPVEIYKEDSANKYISDSWYSHCYLCEIATRLPFPDSPIINKHFICQECFKKYAPKLFNSTSEQNKKFWEDDNKYWMEQEEAQRKSNNKLLNESDLSQEDLSS
jgi:hypothetical protein